MKASTIVLADYLFDAIFVVDTIFYLYFPFIDEATGNIVTDRKIIRAKYRKSWTFVINVAACLPILMVIPTMAGFEEDAIPRDSVNMLRMVSALPHFCRVCEGV